MCTDVPDKFNIIQSRKPVRIIHHKSLIPGKVDKTAHLLLKTLTVMRYRFFRHHASHIASARRIADHSRTAADQCNRFIPCFLQSLHQTKRHKMSYVQTVRRRVKPDVKSRLSFIDQLSDLFRIRQLRKQSSCLQFFINFHVLTIPFRFLLSSTNLNRARLFLCRIFPALPAHFPNTQKNPVL